MNMEKASWIQKIMNSTNGMTTVEPNNDLLSIIQKKIQQQNKVSPKTVWMTAASIAALIAINIVLLGNQNKQKDNTTAVYFENTVNQSNQLY